MKKAVKYKKTSGRMISDPNGVYTIPIFIDIERSLYMTPTGSKKNANDPPRDELLARFFSHQKTGALLKGMGLFIMDCSRNVFVPNTLWKELGYSAEEMAGDRWLDAIHPEDRESVR